MAIRLSGMSSGLDTESIVSALVSGYKTKKEKYQKAQTKLSWTQDAWKDVNKKVYSLYSGLDSLRFSSGYALKKTTVSDPSKVTVSASGAAFNGTQKLKVNKVATTATMTGGKLGSGTTGSTRLSELGFTSNNGQIVLKKGDGTEASFTAKSTSTVNDFVNFLKNNGITASYDTSQQRIYANAKEQGGTGDFTLTAQNAEGLSAMSALGVNLKSDAATKVYTDLAQYANTGTSTNPVYDADATTIKNNILEAISSYKSAGETITNANAANGNLQAAGSYATNYATMRDSLKEAGVDLDSDELGTLREMLRLGSSGYNNSVVGTDGNIYKMVGGSANGDTIFEYEKDGVEKYISRHLTGDVLTEDGVEYKKQATQLAYGSADNMIDVYQKDGDDKLYRRTDDYKLVEIEQAEGESWYQDKEGSEAIVGEPEMEYYTYTGSAKADLGVYTDASGNKFTQHVDDDGNIVEGIYQNGDKFYTAVENVDNTDPDNPVTTYTLTEVKLSEGQTGSSASDYEVVKDDEDNPVTREANSFKADGDYYYIDNANTTADSGIKASYKWMDEFYDTAMANHNTANPSDTWDETKRDSFRNTLNDAIQQVNYFEDHNTKDLDDLHSENGPDPSYAQYSIQSIMDAVKNAYETAESTEAGSGKAAVNTYAESLGTAIYTNKQAIDTETAVQKKYSNLSDLAAMDTSTQAGQDAYNAAITEMVNKVLNAADIIANEANAHYNTDAAKVDGKDAEIELGGIIYTSSNNAFSINGLSIQTLAETKEGEEISITTQTDTQGLYDKIKDFITNYNDVINELTELYNASSAKGYEPLTEDEKSEMSDKQVEKWESKIKDSLLRRDQNLGNIITTMTNAMSRTYSVGGKNYSLASFGIKTLGILKAANNQQNAYHIDGDEDDSITSANADKLMSMLTSDPDSVVSFMQQLTNGIHNSLEQKMRTSTLSSAYTIYNDKEMASEYSDYTKLIKTCESRMSDAETRYQKQFTQMEKALAQLNSNSSAVSGLFG